MRGTTAVRKLHYVNVANSSITNPTQFHDFTGLDPVMADKDEKLLFLAQLVNNGNAVQRQIRVAELSGATFSALSDKYVKALNDGGKTSNFVNWISKDGCHLYFSRGATINSSFKLYTAKRPTKVP